MHCISAIFEKSIHLLAQYLTKMGSQDISAKGAAKSLIKLSTESIGVAAEVDNNIVLKSNSKRKYGNIKDLSKEEKAKRRANEMNNRNKTIDAKTKNANAARAKRLRDKELFDQLKSDSIEFKRRDVEFEKGKVRIAELEERVVDKEKLEAKVLELENDLAECNSLNESMVSSLNSNLINKSKYTMTTKKHVRKSKRLCDHRIHKEDDKQIVMEYIDSMSKCRDGKDNDNPDLLKQNKMSENKFKWIPVYKDGELIRNTIVFDHDGRMIPWFEVRQSTIANAGFGLFSLQKFVKDDVMGRYLGYKVQQGAGNGVYSVATDNFTIDCFPYPREFTGHGVHLANDPLWNPKNSENLKVNANIKTDFVLTCDADIEVDDEIFYSYMNYLNIRHNVMQY